MPRAKMQRASRKIQRHARKHINLGRKKCSGPSVAENPVTYTGYISPASGLDGAKYYVLPAGKTIYVGIYGYGVTDYSFTAELSPYDETKGNNPLWRRLHGRSR